MRERQLLADPLNRLVEAEAGFDADHEQVERVGQAEAHPVLPPLGHPRQHHARAAGSRAAQRDQRRSAGWAADERRQQQREQPRARSATRMPKNTSIASLLR